MNILILYDDVGYIRSINVLEDERGVTPFLDVIPPELHSLVVEVDSMPDRYTKRVIGNELVSIPEPPATEGYEFSLESMEWVPDLQFMDVNNRLFRNRLLGDCDWTQLPDVPSETSEQWISYRQALRDLPAQPGWPNDIDWPEQP
jgi:hypothetical protein